uniref:Uncharacterized protein n=1 Tax=Avena sativa TaxID=4498 RepID=A0ACD5VUX7_AVESA
MERRQLLLSLSFLCLAVLLLPGAAPSSSPATAGRKRRMAGFDHYVLALQWPGTVCRQTNHCCSSNGCCRSNPLNWFTIHGLWPQYSYGGWPSCCRQTTPFNMNKIAMLRPILEKYWPSLYCGHIVAAIDHAFGRLPHLVCKNGSVQELRLCFHKDYQPRDCGSEAEEAWSSSSRRSHCPRYVTFTSYKQSGKIRYHL